MYFGVNYNWMSCSWVSSDWINRRCAARLCMALLAAMLWSAPSLLEASILIPQNELLDVEKLIESADASQKASTSNSTARTTSHSDLANKDTNYNGPGQPETTIILLSQMSTSPIPLGGSTSGTSSTSSSQGTGNYPVDSTVAATISDAELITWIGGEQRFALPMPPGNDLLRPPQFS